MEDSGNETKEIPISKPIVNLRHDWYQTEGFVIVSILLKGLKLVNADVEISEKKVTFRSDSESGSCCLEFNLLYKIAPSQSTWKQAPSKVEIKLKKAEGGYWNDLESKSADAEQHPSSSIKKRDWDKIADDIKKTEEEDLKNLSGEAAVNQLFQKIYADGNEEVRMAMNKSFMESGGTVLSTNWGEVGEKPVDIKPPEGMEFKKWDQ